jgi:hypothetical protein
VEIVPVATPTDPAALARLHSGFLALLPRIETHGRVYFRGVRCPHRREDLIAETVALAWRWFLRLAQRGKDASRFPSALASYAARAVRGGRRAGGQDGGKDVLSPLAQQRHGFAVGKQPDRSTLGGSPLDEALHDNTGSPPDQQAAFSIDFPRWLATLGTRDRRIAEGLALGHRTRELARDCRLSPSRVSQLRRELHRGWRRFHGEAC